MRDRLLYRDVYRGLRSRILTGRYEPGDRIETEPQLAHQFGASLITIRQAQQLLVDEGLLDKQQGRGTFVPPAVRQRLKILCVCGLDLADGLQGRIGSYYTNLIVLSERETARLGMEFETVWLSQRDPDRAHAYCDECFIEEYWGVVFIACRKDHPLLRRVHDTGLRYVVIASHAPSIDRRVWLDYPEAIRLGLDAFGKLSPPVIMGIDSLRRDVETLLRKRKLRGASQFYIPGFGRPHSVEASGYLKTLELLDRGVDFSRTLFLDDVMALGATRALLKAGYGNRKNIRLVVIGGHHEIVPMGLPVVFVTHDTENDVRHAFEILAIPPQRKAGAPLAWRSGFRVVETQTDGTEKSEV